MPKRHIDTNIRKAISPATGLSISQNTTARRTVASSLATANKPLDCPPPSLQILSNILHNIVSAVITVLLFSSRPRCPRLARSVSSQAIFVFVLLIFTSLFTIEGVATVPGAPTGLTTEAGDSQVKLSWTAPTNTGSSPIDDYSIEYYTTDPDDVTQIDVGDASTTTTVTGLTNGTLHTFTVSASNGSGNGPASSSATATPNIPTPTGLTATAGDGQVELSWTAPSLVTVTRYEYNQNSGTSWTSTGTTASGTVTGLTNGTQYTFSVRVVSANGNGTASSSATATPNIAAPTGLTATPGDREVRLSWTAVSGVTTITGYQYSQNGGSSWTSTSTNTSHTVGSLINGVIYIFRVRAVGTGGGGTASASQTATPRTSQLQDTPEGGQPPNQNPLDDLSGQQSSVQNPSVNPPVDTSPQTPPKRKIIIQDCPVGWVRSDGFGGRNRRVLIYEVNLEMDLQNPVSIYKPIWVAIYVHPDEGLENLQGWKLQVALPYNRHREYPLTAENSVVVDANFVEGGFAFIENPEEDPFPMTGVGFTGSPAPGFDYRLYDKTGRKVDFGISCYKRFDVFQVLKDAEDPRVLRQVLLESFDWNSHYLRSEWTVPTPAPAAPSLIKKDIVGTWADLKKQ